VRVLARGGLQRGHHHVLDLVQQDRRRPSRPRLIMQALQAPGDEPGPPAIHRRLIHTQISCGLLVCPALRAAQHDLRPQRQVLGSLRPPGPGDQLRPLTLLQHQVSFTPADRRGVLKPGQPLRGELTPPLGHRLDRHPQRLRSPGIRHPLSTCQDDPGPVSPPAPGNPARRTNSARSSSDSTICTAEGPERAIPCRLAELTLRTSDAAH